MTSLSARVSASPGLLQSSSFMKLLLLLHMSLCIIAKDDTLPRGAMMEDHLGDGRRRVRGASRKQTRDDAHSNHPKRRSLLDFMEKGLSTGYGGVGGSYAMDDSSWQMRQKVFTGAPSQSLAPSSSPSHSLAPSSSRAPSSSPTRITYDPGNLAISENGLLLSKGLQSTILARAGEPVPYLNNGESRVDFHEYPDGGATFPDHRPNNPGGWIYVSNSEVPKKKGGVGAITFDANGNILDYRMLLTGTTMNCNGGRTPWGTWVSAEEDFDKAKGKLYEVDPTGQRNPQLITLGSTGGIWEAFAYDIRDLQNPHFFVTEDDDWGALERFTPYHAEWNNTHNMLTSEGVLDYLVLTADNTFYWTTDRATARASAFEFYQNTEGIAIQGSKLFFVCKYWYRLYELDLDDMTYQFTSTRAGLFSGQPDQIRTILGDDGQEMFYFSEDGGSRAGIHARTMQGDLLTILEGKNYIPETTGLSLSPNGKHMYFNMQHEGILFDVTRTDGLSFRAKTLNVKLHPTEQ